MPPSTFRASPCCPSQKQSQNETLSLGVQIKKHHLGNRTSTVVPSWTQEAQQTKGYLFYVRLRVFNWNGWLARKAGRNSNLRFHSNKCATFWDDYSLDLRHAEKSKTDGRGNLDKLRLIARNSEINVTWSKLKIQSDFVNLITRSTLMHEVQRPQNNREILIDKGLTLSPEYGKETIALSRAWSKVLTWLLRHKSL